MKKIVALVLSLVMVLGLATTAFGAITVPQWITNNPGGFDVYDGNNVKLNAAAVKVEFHPAVAPTAANAWQGNIAYYTLDSVVYDIAENATYAVGQSFVMVPSYEKTAIAVKAYNALIPQGQTYQSAASQSVPTATYFLKPVSCVLYNFDASKFDGFGTMCGDIAAPAFVATATEKQVVARWTQTFAANDPINVFKGKTIDQILLLGAGDESQAAEYRNFLVDGVIYTDVARKAVSYVPHAWVASEYDAKTGAVTKYTCATCKVVGTVVTSPFLAPADAEIEQLNNLTYVYFYTAAKAPAGDKVESAQTFDAGIAMYVGMSVMAAAGSAVVLKKKD